MTPSQTVGPFFHFSLTAKPVGKMASADTKGDAVRLTVRVFDADGVPVPDAIIELWQADASGKYEHPEDTQSGLHDPSFCGFGRMETDRTGSCTFETIRPGRVPGLSDVHQAPHINVTVLARGMLSHLFTRIYFAGEPSNDLDAALALVPQDRRSTLVAQPDAEHTGAWTFDIYLSGDRETVFFDF